MKERKVEKREKKEEEMEEEMEDEMEDEGIHLGDVLEELDKCELPEPAKTKPIGAHHGKSSTKKKSKLTQLLLAGAIQPGELRH